MRQTNLEIEAYLKHQRVPYEVLIHPAAPTAQEQAHEAHVSGHEWAKTVVFLTVHGTAVMAVVPAPLHVDVARLEAVVGRGPLRLATEAELAALYPDCEPGAQPPLGCMYGQDVYVDVRLASAGHIVFDSGSHTRAVRIPYFELARLTRPTVARFAT